MARLAKVILLVACVLVLVSCSGGSDSEVRPTVTAGSQPKDQPDTCDHEWLFRGFREVTELPISCPGWLPAGLKVNAFGVGTPPMDEYMVDYTGGTAQAPHLFIRWSSVQAEGRLIRRIGPDASIRIYAIPRNLDPNTAPLHPQQYAAVAADGANPGFNYSVTVDQLPQGAERTVAVALRTAQSFQRVRATLPQHPCRDAAVFAALGEAIGAPPLCPTVLPRGVMPRGLAGFLGSSRPSTLVEYTPSSASLPHLAFVWTKARPPGRPVTTIRTQNSKVPIYFLPAAGRASLHTDHYIAVVPGAPKTDLHLWVSLHASRGTDAGNIAAVSAIVRSLRSID